MSNHKKKTKLLISIATPLILGLVAGTITSRSVDTWYAALKKPIFNPPNWVFGPVWTILYILMGISFYLVWTSDQKNPFYKKALFIYAIQLILNFLWSVIFFGFQLPTWAFMEILLLLLAISTTILVFYRVHKKASYLLFPYLFWVSFATILNAAIVIANR